MASNVFPRAIMFGLLSLSLPFPSTAGPVPQQLTEKLKDREQRLNNLELNWQMTYHQRNSSESPREIQARQEAAREQLPPQLRRAGLDEKTISQVVKSAVESAVEQGKGASYHSTTSWDFERTGDQALVSGNRESIKDGTREYFSSEFHQFYDKNWGLVINDGNKADGKPVQPRLLSAWAAPGNGLYYESGIADGLQLRPEHFTMLLGLNPLAIYGGAWKTTQVNSQIWKLEAPVTQNGHLLFIVSCVLDRLHGNAPLQIQANRNGQIFTFKADHYRQYNGEWLCDKVDLHEQLPDKNMRAGTDIYETWTLHSIGITHPLRIIVPKSLPVKDYRLLGNQIYGVFEANLSRSQKQSIVTYRWPGYFMSLNDLKKLQQRQHPGEDAPDLGQSGFAPLGTRASAASAVGSIMPFAGGVLCLAGGVWMFKQRKAN